MATDGGLHDLGVLDCGGSKNHAGRAERQKPLDLIERADAPADLHRNPNGSEYRSRDF